jgi:hypothetical protein
MSWTAIAPEPTDGATRLTEPWRTSPTANTPGMLVSRYVGARPWNPAVESDATSLPVNTKPLGSRRDR